ncbi:MAG: hypothetical protein O3A63_02530 [Proteobacteria bacterium]|nr:hypothetical protein [Pseudomonadota bacterium]
MSGQHLKGRIFHRKGTNYLVIDKTGWQSEMVTVRSINARKRIFNVPRAEVIRCLGDSIARAS